MEQGFTPPFENDGFNISQVRENFLKILESHILVLPSIVF